jgi:hypothetical protein
VAGYPAQAGNQNKSAVIPAQAGIQIIKISCEAGQLNLRICSRRELFFGWIPACAHKR